MSVYVDDLYKSAIGAFGRMKMSHMIADTSAELHAMADRIGVARKWVQHAGRFDEHYDIALTKRAQAVRAGAIEITWRELAEKVRARREASR